MMNTIKKIPYLVIILIFFKASFALGNYIVGPFFVSDKSYSFTKALPSGKKCTGKIPYPVLYNDQEEIIDALNEEITDFIHIYAICNEVERSNFSVNFDFPPSGSTDYLSIRWVTKKNGKIHRIDSLNFDTINANFVKLDEVFNLSSSSFFQQIVNISGGHLHSSDDWEVFLDKINDRDIQYYVKNKEWYLVFNSTPLLDKIVNVKIPQYFLEGDDVDNAG